jgi:hypothetical protein
LQQRGEPSRGQAAACGVLERRAAWCPNRTRTRLHGASRRPPRNMPPSRSIQVADLTYINVNLSICRPINTPTSCQTLTWTGASLLCASLASKHYVCNQIQSRMLDQSATLRAVWGAASRGRLLRAPAVPRPPAPRQPRARPTASAAAAAASLEVVLGATKLMTLDRCESDLRELCADLALAEGDAASSRCIEVRAPGTPHPERRRGGAREGSESEDCCCTCGAWKGPSVSLIMHGPEPCAPPSPLRPPTQHSLKRPPPHRRRPPPAAFPHLPPLTQPMAWSLSLSPPPAARPSPCAPQVADYFAARRGSCQAACQAELQECGTPGQACQVSRVGGNGPLGFVCVHAVPKGRTAKARARTVLVSPASHLFLHTARPHRLLPFGGAPPPAV